MIQFRARSVDDVADRALIVRQEPRDLPRGVFVGQDLVHGRPVQEAVRLRLLAVELQRDAVAVVDESLNGRGLGPGTVGVDRLRDPAVVHVVGIVRLAGHGASGGGEDDSRKPVAVIPGVLGHVARRNLGLANEVPFGVVGVVAFAVGEDAVVGAGGVGRARAVAVGVVTVGVTGLGRIHGGREFARGVVGIGEGPGGAGLGGDPVGGVERPLVLGQRRGPADVGKLRQPPRGVVGVGVGGIRVAGRGNPAVGVVAVIERADRRPEPSSHCSLVRRFKES